MTSMVNSIVLQQQQMILANEKVKGWPLKKSTQRLIGNKQKSRIAHNRHVYAGRLQARRQGLRKRIWIDVEELRRLATELEYRFNEELANKLAQ
jgi:elongation factor P hydroxylase